MRATFLERLMRIHKIIVRYPFFYLLSYLKRSGDGKDVLIVKTDALGDQVIFSFAVEHICGAFPGSRIAILVQDSVSSFYENCPFVQEIIPLNKRRFVADAAYAIRFIRMIRQRKFLAVFHPVYSRDPTGDQIATSSGAERIIGMVGNQSNEPGWIQSIYNRRYTELIPEENTRSAFEGHRYLAILRHLGESPSTAAWKPVVWVGAPDRAEAEKILREFGLTRKKFAVVAPGAGDRIRCWAPEKFSDIADRLFEEFGLSILLAGAAGEKDIVGRVKSGMRNPSISIAGRTTMAVLAAVLEDAAILVGNESAPVHLSLSVGTPAVCVIGGGHYGRFLPYPGEYPLRCVSRPEDCFGCNWVCDLGTPYCIINVDADEVWSAARDLLGNIRRS